MGYNYNTYLRMNFTRTNMKNISILNVFNNILYENMTILYLCFSFRASHKMCEECHFWIPEENVSQKLSFSFQDLTFSARPLPKVILNNWKTEMATATDFAFKTTYKTSVKRQHWRLIFIGISWPNLGHDLLIIAYLRSPASSLSRHVRASDFIFLFRLCAVPRINP